MSGNYSIREQKSRLRREILDEAGRLDRGYTERADRQIIAHLEASREYREASCIFCFVGTGTEIRTSSFLEKALKEGKTVTVPLCTGKGIMEARQILSLRDLKQGRYGLWEPGTESRAVNPEQIGFAVIPCVCASHDGKRLGYGGGYYDRYFRGYPLVPAIIVCREHMIREDIPTEEHDLMFRCVITEKGRFENGLPVNAPETGRREEKR